MTNILRSPLGLLWFFFLLLVVWCLSQELVFALHVPDPENAMWFYQFENIQQG